jgi:hypothetical protein
LLYFGLAKVERSGQNLDSGFHQISKIVSLQIFFPDETNRMLTTELNTNTEHRLKIVQLEEEKLVLNKELDCLKRELSEKSADLNSERTKLENLIRAEQVTERIA